MSPRIVILREPIDAALLAELAAEVFGDMVKFVVDVERGMMAAGGEMHVDAEALLLEDGSDQSHLWVGNYFPAAEPAHRIEYASLINLRPAQDNSQIHVQDPRLREQIRVIVERLLGPGTRSP